MTNKINETMMNLGIPQTKGRFATFVANIRKTNKKRLATYSSRTGVRIVSGEKSVDGQLNKGGD